MPKSPQKRNRSSPAYRIAGLGTELAGAILGFTLVGFWIDRHYGTSPWGLVICAVLGLIGGLYNFFRASLRTLKKVGTRGSQGTGHGGRTREAGREDSGGEEPSGEE